MSYQLWSPQRWLSRSAWRWMIVDRASPDHPDAPAGGLAQRRNGRRDRAMQIGEG